MIDDDRMDAEPQPQVITQSNEGIDWESVQWLEENEKEMSGICKVGQTRSSKFRMKDRKLKFQETMILK